MRSHNHRYSRICALGQRLRQQRLRQQRLRQQRLRQQRLRHLLFAFARKWGTIIFARKWLYWLGLGLATVALCVVVGGPVSSQVASGDSVPEVPSVPLEDWKSPTGFCCLTTGYSLSSHCGTG